MPDIDSEPFPYAKTLAAIMLRSALERASNERMLSIRTLAKQLGIKQATFISQMANGRNMIPLERAVALALAVDLPPAAFLAAAVAQRVPDALDLLCPKDSCTAWAER